MTFDWGTLFGMALQTVPEPRKVARDIQSIRLPHSVLWQILALILVSSTFLAVISSILFPVPAEEAGTIFASPLLMGVAQASVAAIMVHVIYWIGRALGGKGRFDQALLTVIWLHFVTLIVQLGVTFLGVFAPGMALLLLGMGFVMTFWILSHFIAEMHGFRSAGLVFAGIIATILLLLVFLSIVLTIFTLVFIPDAGVS